MKNTFGKSYRAIVEPDYPTGYVAVLPAIPGLVAHGESEQTSMELLCDLLRNYLSQLQSEGESFPEDTVEIFWDEEDEETGARLVTIEV
jgi:predicted RNase H-like HicB family nuclease